MIRKWRNQLLGIKENIPGNSKSLIMKNVDYKKVKQTKSSKVGDL